MNKRKRRIRLFILHESYSEVARIEKVDPATIRKQMQSVKDPEVQAIVKKISHRKDRRCTECKRDKNYCAKGLCNTCYNYFYRKPLTRRGRQIFITT